MARLARVVVPGWPHHVLQRGVRSLPLFTSDADRPAYLKLLAEFGTRYGLTVWAWCLMTNHVHLVVVPARPDSLARAIGEAHRRDTRAVNCRAGVRGHLFQERFHSFPVQTEPYLWAVLRYVERNPVRAHLVPQAEDYPWSSARSHVTGSPDRLVQASPIRALGPAWRQGLEQQLGRPLLPRKGGWPKGRPRTVAVLD